MAGDGYVSKGYTTYTVVDPHTNGWKQPGYEGHGYSEQVPRSATVDATWGRNKPMITSYKPPNPNITGYVKTKTIVEHVGTPMGKEFGANNEKFCSPSTPTGIKDYGAVHNNKWFGPLSPPNARPQEVEEFVTQVRTEVSQVPTRRILPGTTYWQSTRDTSDQNGAYGYGGWNKPNGHVDTTLTNTGPGYPLTKPTNDISEAGVALLKEATVTALLPRATLPVSSKVPKRDTSTEVIDVARRCARPVFRTIESKIGTVDSKEAVRKYNGTTVP